MELQQNNVHSSSGGLPASCPTADCYSAKCFMRIIFLIFPSILWHPVFSNDNKNHCNHNNLSCLLAIIPEFLSNDRAFCFTVSGIFCLNRKRFVSGNALILPPPSPPPESVCVRRFRFILGGCLVGVPAFSVGGAGSRICICRVPARNLFVFLVLRFVHFTY